MERTSALVALLPTLACKLTRLSSMPPRLGPQGKKYTILSVLGRGGFGTAYLVRPRGDWTTLRVLKCVSMEMMDKQQQQAALHECTVLSKLRQHPFIISVHAHFLELGRLWIVMDYAE